MKDFPPGNGSNDGKGLSTNGVQLAPSMPIPPKPAPSHERAGYKIMDHVEKFISTPAGEVPRLKTRKSIKDHLTTMATRCGINRHQYKVAPGLYAVGNPTPESPVLVTANFKLTFDLLREAVAALDTWILVLDTKGVNVWCAAGKGTFATAELVHRIKESQLEKVVDHKRLILPQLGATGVTAGAVKKQSGFRVIYGPIRANDIPAFLENKNKATPEMRQMSFTLKERLVLTPVEVQITLKPALITALIMLIISGIGPEIFSFSAAWSRGLTAMAAMACGIFSGAVLAPALLPHIPVREFALKGVITGVVTSLAHILTLEGIGFVGANALFWFTIAVSSFLAMNFTGTTPFTSPSGVEKEMKRYIPFQLASLVLAAGLWIWSGF